MSRPQHDRAAALAAAEARLRGLPPPNAAVAKPPPAPWVQPTEKQDQDSKKLLNRLIARGIVRDNGYKQSAEAVETLLKIANNILEHSDESKYRTIKATNSVLVNKVFAAVGGREYFVAMGFRSQTTDFQQSYVLQPTLKRMHELRLAAQVLNDHLEQLRERANNRDKALANAKADEQARKARALADIDADRDYVKQRAAREKLVREQRELKAKEDKEREEREQAEAEQMSAEEGEAHDEQARDESEGEQADEQPQPQPVYGDFRPVASARASSGLPPAQRGSRDYRPRDERPYDPFAYLSAGQRLGDPPASATPNDGSTGDGDDDPSFNVDDTASPGSGSDK